MLDLSTSPPIWGDTAILLGCGPSLDRFVDSKQATRSVCSWGVNEAALKLDPFRRICIAWDQQAVDAIKAHAERTGGYEPIMIVEKEIWDRTEWVRSDGFYYRRKQVVEEGWRFGTATIALGLFAQHGIKTVHLVGFDGFWAWLRRHQSASEGPVATEGYDGAFGCAKAVQAVSSIQRGSVADYDRISESMWRVAQETGLQLEEGWV